MNGTSESNAIYSAYIDKNHAEDAPVLTVVKHVHNTTSIVLPKTLSNGDLASAMPEADSTLDRNGFKRTGDWKTEDQYRLSAAIEKNGG